MRVASRSSATELLEKLEVAHASLGAGSVMASDGDGTLWQGDIGDELFLAALRDDALREPARAALLEEAKRHSVDTHGAGGATDVARRLFGALQAGRYDEERAFGMMAWAFAGWSLRELALRSRQVLDDIDFEAALRTELRPVLVWARDRGVPLWLVTASPLAIALEAAGRLSIPAERVVAMEPAVQGGVVQPRLAKRTTYGQGKLLRLREATDAPLLAAFGDSSYDAAMLRAAELPVAVHPSPELQALAPAIKGLVVVGGL